MVAKNVSNEKHRLPHPVCLASDLRQGRSQYPAGKIKLKVSKTTLEQHPIALNVIFLAFNSNSPAEITIPSMFYSKNGWNNVHQ